MTNKDFHISLFSFFFSQLRRRLSTFSLYPFLLSLLPIPDSRFTIHHSRALLFLLFTLHFSPAYAQSLSGLKVCIDPGHGGSNPANDRHIIPDPGTDFWESESNFQKALLLKALLEERGVTVLLTRNTNSYPNDADEPSLSARVAFANTNNVDWFHSIHSNASGAPLGTSTANRTLMLVREKRSLTDPGASSGNGMGIPEQQESWDISLIMSPTIQNALGTTSHSTWLDWSFYGGTNGGFSLGVLRGLLMPGQLSEGSFHDFYPETRRLMNNSYRKLEAYALRNSFMQYFSVPADTLAYVKGIQTEQGTGRLINYSRVRLLPEDTVYVGDQYNNGFYLHDRLVEGPRTLIFETAGYIRDTVEFTATPGARLTFNVSLEPLGAPTLLSNFPTDGDTTFLANQSVSIQFTKIMDTASVRTAFSIDPQVNGRFLWSTNNTVLTFDPDSVVFPFDVWFTITIDSNARSASGFVFDGNGDGTPGDPFVLTFRPKPVDAWPPALVYGRAVEGDTLSSPLEVLNYTWDELVAPTSVTTTNIAMQKIGSSLQPLTFQTWAWRNRSGFNVYPTNGIQAGAGYKIRIYGIRDYAGNSIPTTSTLLWTFAVSPHVYTTEVLDDFEGGIARWEDVLTNAASTGYGADSTLWEARQNILMAGIAGNTKAAFLQYKWDTAATSNALFIEPDSTFQQMSGLHARLQMYVWGDGGMNSIRFVLGRTSGQTTGEPTIYSPWTTVHWIGWHMVEYPLDVDSTGQSVSDSSAAGMITFRGIEVAPGGPGSSLSGQLIFDNVQIAREVITGVPDSPGENVPTDFVLGQNFPNPFNPTTQIHYSLPVAALISLKVFDLLGREVAILAEGMHSFGHHSVTFDASSHPTGIYLVELRTDQVRRTKKIVLLK